MKVSELTGAKLDYWVAVALGDRIARIVGAEEHERCETRFGEQWPWNRFMPSRAWMDGGPVMEKAAIGWRDCNPSASVHVGAHKGLSSVEGQPWEAWFCDDGPEGGNVVHQHVQVGRTMLEASMRAYVVSKYGDEVPEE